jgi:hypothetical protein
VMTQDVSRTIGHSLTLIVRLIGLSRFRVDDTRTFITVKRSLFSVDLGHHASCVIMVIHTLLFLIRRYSLSGLELLATIPANLAIVT